MITIDKAMLAQIMRQNRADLATVRSWITDTDYENSILNYGLPRDVRPYVDSFVGEEATYSDVIAYFAARLAMPVRYLEIGVSVGKNFFQMLHRLTHAELTGVDIENINPILERYLERAARSEWPSMPESLRKRPSYLAEYEFPKNANHVRYIAGDVFDDRTWAQLTGRQFNLVFSDAYHSADALVQEWQRIKALQLLDGQEFVMLWDDLDTAGMRNAFKKITLDMQIVFAIPSNDIAIRPCRGWIGPHEPPHAIGIVYKRRIETRKSQP